MMKKRLFLGLFPALLVLASCQATPKIEPKAVLDNIVEDTEAHDEIFGQSKDGFYQIGVKKLDIPLTPDQDDSIPAIGIQSKVDDNDTPSNPMDDTVSIRFVAAVKLADSASASVVWTRTMYNNDGSVFTGKEEKNYPSTKAYQTIAAANANESDPEPDVLTIEAFNAAPRNTAYTHFVVYTMTNIPLVAYGNCFLNAYVTVNDSVSSKELAARIDRGIILSFDKDQTGFFLVDDEKKVVQVDESIKGSNLAAFSTDLNCDGYFSIVEKEDSFFKVHDPSVEDEDDSSYFVFRDSDIRRIGVAVGASYELFLSSTNELSVVASGTFVRYVYLDITEVSWWGEDRKAALWSWGGTEPASWIELEEVDPYKLWMTEIPIDPREYNLFCVADVKKDRTPSWDDDSVINKTNDTATLSTNDKKDTIKLKNNKPYDKWEIYDWQSSYTA